MFHHFLPLFYCVVIIVFSSIPSCSSDVRETLNKSYLRYPKSEKSQFFEKKTWKSEELQNSRGYLSVFGWFSTRFYRFSRKKGIVSPPEMLPFVRRGCTSADWHTRTEHGNGSCFWQCRGRPFFCNRNPF